MSHHRTPDRESYLNFARIMAEARWEHEHGRPQKARANARTWIGIIELMVMGSSEGYTRAYWNKPYDPPKPLVIPAAEGITMDGLGFNARFLPAGTTFHFDERHLDKVQKQLGYIEYSEGPQDGTLTTTLQDDRTLITWSTQCGLIFPDPRYPPMFNTFLLKADGSEHETARVTCRIVAVFPTEEEAICWAARRTDELQLEHDRNHARLKQEWESQRNR